MLYTLNWSERAVTNLNTIKSYIAENSLSNANKVVNELLDYAEELKKFPLIGPVISELSDRKLRQLVKYSYRIVYLIEGNVITIVAVIHVRQNITAQFINNSRY